ncbi:hypothetical protein B0H14DRAFT_3872150, partial [Mycena olivaceomarginata]
MDPAAGERRGGRNNGIVIASASGSEGKLKKPSTRGDNDNDENGFDGDDSASDEHPPHRAHAGRLRRLSSYAYDNSVEITITGKSMLGLFSGSFSGSGVVAGADAVQHRAQQRRDVGEGGMGEGEGGEGIVLIKKKAKARGRVAAVFVNVFTHAAHPPRSSTPAGIEPSAKEWREGAPAPTSSLPRAPIEFAPVRVQVHTTTRVQQWLPAEPDCTLYMVEVLSVRGHGIQRAILRLVTAQRDDTQIDEALVKKVVDSFVSLGLDAVDPDKEGLDAYKDEFGGVPNTRNNVVCFGPPTC